MRIIYVSTSEELYRAFEAMTDFTEPIKIMLQKDTVYEIDKPLVITRDNVSIIGENTVLKGSKRIAVCDTGEKTDIRLNEYGIGKTDGLAEGPFADFWHEYAIPKPYMDDFGMGTALFYEDEALPVARYPKTGFCNVERLTDAEKGVFVPQDRKIFSWSGYENLLLVGYWHYEWANQRCGIEGLDKEQGTVSLKPPYHCFGYCDGAHYFAMNVRDEITQRGEWAKDAGKNTVTLYPKENQTYVDVSVADNVIEANGVSDIHIKGIAVKECKKNGILITESKNVTVEKCEVKNAGGWGIIADSCENAVIKHCRVQCTGGGGIAAFGGNRIRLIPSDNKIIGCTVSRVAQWHRTYTAAIQMCGTGGLVSGCKIYNVPHFAIVYHGNNHIIENNEICDACYESNDAGAIYSGADWTCRGNIIRGNYFHDINGFMGKGCYGIYFDDYVSSARVYDNLFVNVHQGILIGGGRDYVITNNTFYGGVSAVVIDDRTNVKSDAIFANLFKKAEAVGYKSEIWQTAYPELADIENQIYDREANNLILRNSVTDCDETKSFVYIKNGERAEFARERDFRKMCNKNK